MTPDALKRLRGGVMLAEDFARFPVKTEFTAEDFLAIQANAEDYARRRHHDGKRVLAAVATRDAARFKKLFNFFLLSSGDPPVGSLDELPGAAPGGIRET